MDSTASSLTEGTENKFLGTIDKSAFSDKAYTLINGDIHQWKDNQISLDDSGRLVEKYAIEKIPSPDFSIPKFGGFMVDHLKNYFFDAQKWYGQVISINENTFTAKLQDLSNATTDEVGEFEIKEIPDDDKELFKLGATFYWSVGYEMKNSQVSKRSFFRFQRLPNWNSIEIDNALDRANDLSSNLNWE